jgi:asparagine synthase (glutamine-hydrolysing)
MQYIDINLWLPGDILLKADKTSMAHGLEIRSPLLDKEVFRLASKIPTKFRVNQENTKYAFRLAAKRHLPTAISQKKKLGFPVPTRLWLREDRYYERVKAAFESERAKTFFHTAPLLDLLDAHKSGKADNSRKIWTVFVFLVWHEAFFGDAPTAEGE